MSIVIIVSDEALNFWLTVEIFIVPILTLHILRHWLPHAEKRKKWGFICYLGLFKHIISRSLEYCKNYREDGNYSTCLLFTSITMVCSLFCDASKRMVEIFSWLFMPLMYVALQSFYVYNELIYLRLELMNGCSLQKKASGWLLKAQKQLAS